MLTLFEHNAKRHDARAAMWRAQGKPDYAAGSERKAARWRKNGLELQQALCPAGQGGPLGDLLDELLARVSADLAAGLDNALHAAD